MKLRSFIWALLCILLAASPAGSGSMTLLGAGKAGVAAGCAEATNFVTRANASTTLNAAHANAVTTMICGMVTDGTFAKLDALYMFATDTQAHSALSLVSATYNGTYSGMTFTADQGMVYSGGGSNFSTAFTPSSASSPNMTLNSGSFGIWDNAAGAGDGNNIFQNNSVGDRLYPTFSSTIIGNLNGSNNLTVANTVAAALYHVNVSGASAQQLYKNGASVATLGSGVTGVAATPWVIGNPATSTDPVLAFWIGGSFNGTEAANMYARLHTYLQTIAGIP